MQQHKEKMEAEKRVLVAKQKAIIDETEELLANLPHLPPNPSIAEILTRRGLNAAKAMKKLSPEVKMLKSQVQELDARLKASIELTLNHEENEASFVLPDNEQQLIAMLQCIKKLRVVLKSEQNKGVLNANLFMKHDKKLDSLQLKINIESLLKRGMQAYSKEMLGSARQYFEKAIQSLESHPTKTEYTQAKLIEVREKLGDITNALKNTNAQDAQKKAKDNEDDLDMLFAPKKKW
jgi:hypothetical protein